MQQLEQNPLPPDVYAASLFSEADLICPARLCSLDIPEGSTHLLNVPIEGMNHADFMVDPHVYDIIKTNLDEGFRRAEAVKSD